MVNFGDAFKRGLENAEKASRNRERINALVEKMSHEIVEATHGDIAKIEIKDCARFVPDPNVWIINQESLLAPRPGKTVEYTGLVAARKSNENGEADTILCEFKISPTGFPVVLVYSNRNVVCSDEDGLENALKELLEHPDTADRLHELLVGNA